MITQRFLCSGWRLTYQLLVFTTKLWHAAASLGNEMKQISTPYSSVTAQLMSMKLEPYNYCQKTTYQAKQYFNQTTWVVWANT